MSTFDFRCPKCFHDEEIKGAVGAPLSPTCPKCQSEMTRYFGGGQQGLVNYGYREHRYDNETDRNIAKFQFEHL